MVVVGHGSPNIFSTLTEEILHKTPIVCYLLCIENYIPVMDEREVHSCSAPKKDSNW